MHNGEAQIITIEAPNYNTFNLVAMSVDAAGSP